MRKYPPVLFYVQPGMNMDFCSVSLVGIGFTVFHFLATARFGSIEFQVKQAVSFILGPGALRSRLVHPVFPR